MPTAIPISELKQRTGRILSQAVLTQEDIIIERYGEEYAVILSRARYQELLDTAQASVRGRFLRAQQEVYAETEAMSEAEVERLVRTAVTQSRRSRAGIDESHS
ncbi:MAG: type II toxin-antitoxin system prevent-host-death family antitoxin [Aquificales bacterium]|nr:type II toxin-antitoxin system prevent-host-death family antitoxin [Aquificales bacterium]